MNDGTDRACRASCPKNILVSPKKLIPLYVIDGRFRVFLVSGPKKFAPNMSLYICMSAQIALSVHRRQKIFFRSIQQIGPLYFIDGVFRVFLKNICPYLYMSAQIAKCSYRRQKYFHAARQTEPSYVIDGTFRVSLVSPPKFFCPLYTYVGTNRVFLVPGSKIFLPPNS